MKYNLLEVQNIEDGSRFECFQEVSDDGNVNGYLSLEGEQITLPKINERSVISEDEKPSFIR